MSEWNPSDPPDDAPPQGGTMVAVPRVGPGAAPQAPAPAIPEAGGTMVGIGRVNIPGAAPSFGGFAMPAPAAAPEAGGTMVGIGRVNVPPGGFAPPAPASYAPPEAGGTMVGIGRVNVPGPAAAPSFGGMAMPLPQQAAPEAGGTMVGIGRVNVPGAAPSFGGMAMPAAAPEAGGTMVGIGRVNVPGAGFAPPAQAPEAGGTMVGIGRVNVGGQQGFGPPAQAPEAGGTMVGIGRVNLGGQQGFAPPAQAPEAGGTMVGMARVGTPGAGFGFAPPPPARPSGPPPTYDIIAHLGGGELGQVFHARHRETGGEYALRIVRPDIAAVPGAVEALRDVVALAQNAVHTHLGRQVGLDEQASPTLVLEYVPGKQLASLMKERGPAPAPAVIDLGVRLCSALAAAHGAGLAHGRVHAGNVVLEAKTGRWVLLDLGHAYAVQALEPIHDLYALGALLYEMATGHSPFEGEVQPVPDPRSYKPQLPAALSALLIRTLAPDPALWFPTALEMAQALARAKNQP